MDLVLFALMDIIVMVVTAKSVVVIAKHALVQFFAYHAIK